MRSLELSDVPKSAARRWASANRTIFKNAGAMTGATLVTSALGFGFWWLAARLFPAESVGVASALVSAMMLLATLSVLGLETHLLGELRRDPGTARSLFATAAIAVGAVGAVVGLVLALVLPTFSSELQAVRDSPGGTLVFAGGVSVCALAVVLDNAFVGLLRGELQLLRNAVHAVAKLALLAVAGYLLATTTGIVVVAAWVGGTFASLFLVFMIRRLLPGTQSSWKPRWTLLSEIKGAAISHHALNIVLQTPLYLLPIIAAIEVSAVAAAHFYAPLMTSTFLFVLPVSLTTALYAFSNPDRMLAAATLRHSLVVSVLLGVLGAAVLIVAAPFILELFGPDYAAAGTDSLRVLSLAVFPVLVRSHYVTISRVRRQMRRAAVLFAFVGVLEVSLAWLGASTHGVTGLSVGWLVGVSLGAVVTLPTMVSSLRAGTRTPEPAVLP